LIKPLETTAMPIIISRFSDPYINLSIGTYITQMVKRSLSNTLFLCSSHHGVFVGRYQNIWKECNMAAMRQDSIPLIRRDTGGGACYVDRGNRLFSFVEANTDPQPKKYFPVIINAVNSLNLNGYTASMQGSNDIVIHKGTEARKRKISGSAFTFDGYVFRHHGTMLINVDKEKLETYLTPSAEELQSKGITSVRARITNLTDINPDITANDFDRSLINAYRNQVKLSQDGDIFILDEHTIHDFITDKEAYKNILARYQSDDFIYNENPDFTHRIEHQFSFGKLEILLLCVKNKISSCEIFTKSLDIKLIAALKDTFINKDYRHDTIDLIEKELLTKLGHRYVEKIQEFSSYMRTLHKNVAVNARKPDYFSEEYAASRNAFIAAAKQNAQIVKIDSLPISAKGPDGMDLFIDIAVMGNLNTCTKLVFHFSAIHGIEGFAGAGIQCELLTNSIPLPEKTAIIFVHGLNPFGMAWNRRVNESNIDLNRNLVASHEKRESPKLYASIDSIVNPKSITPFNQQAYQEICDKHGHSAIRSALAGGQYDYPEGLFYGGKEIAEGPRVFLNWCDALFMQLQRDLSQLSFVIIDVHTGLGEFAVDTLLTNEETAKKLFPIFGKKISLEKQADTGGYKIKGKFGDYLAQHLCRVAKVQPESILVITQEFGTRPEKEVFQALYDENMHFHHTKRNPEKYNPCGPAGQRMLYSFFPAEPSWRADIVSRGRELVETSLQIQIKKMK